MKNKHKTHITDAEGLLKTTVVNLFNRQLTQTEQTILSKGLNFSICPKHIPKFDFISAIEESTRKLPPYEGKEYRIRAKIELEKSIWDYYDIIIFAPYFKTFS